MKIVIGIWMFLVFSALLQIILNQVRMANHHRILTEAIIKAIKIQTDRLLKDSNKGVCR